jgi:hypothetical protein
MNAMVYSQTKGTAQKSTWKVYKNTGYHRITGERLGFVKTTHNLFEKKVGPKIYNRWRKKGWTKNIQPMEKNIWVKCMFIFYIF